MRLRSRVSQKECSNNLMFERRDLITHSSHIAFESGTILMFQFEQQQHFLNLRTN